MTAPVRIPRWDYVHDLPKPRLRGRIHAVAAPCVAAVTTIGAAITTGVAMLAMILYGIAMTAVCAVSAVYHHARSPRGQRVLQRADHSMISIAVGASGVAFYLVQPATTTNVVLASATAGLALVSMITKATGRFWLGGTAGFFITGALGGVAMPGLVSVAGPVAAGLVAAGGVTYVLGAVCLMCRLPRVSYHEVWHAATVVGIGLHFAALIIAVT